MGKSLSNPFSTGGGGAAFENQVQSAFVVLMLSGGCVPCLAPWPIRTIKLQGKYEGYATDDFIAFVEERGTARKAKLLAQIKHAVSITENDDTFKDVIASAWEDFQNPGLFERSTDAIALITGPLSATDIDSVRTILEWARTCASASEFLAKVERAQFSSDTKRKKLRVFRNLLSSTKGSPVTEDELWQFLKCFHLLGYDLGWYSSVTVSLLNSHIAQFEHDDISGLWAKIGAEVEKFNKTAGTITRETLSSDLINAFAQKLPVAQIPSKLLETNDRTTAGKPVKLSGDRGDAIMIASLLGGWNDASKEDKAVIERLIGRE